MAAALPLPELKVDNALATAGYYRLEWRLPAVTSDDDMRYVVQEAQDNRFHDAITLYEGPDLAMVLSGREDGLRYYRVRASKGDQPLSQWSESISVETRHHSLLRALAFFAIGALVFAATLVLILRGPREQGRGGHTVRERSNG